MAGKKIPVETVLTGRDAGVKAVWEQAARAAEKYGQVVGYATGAFNTFQRLATGGLVFAAGAGFVDTFRNIVKVGSEAEKTAQSLAGSFQVYGFTNSFARGMALATKQVAEFKKEAAALPGTTADFLQSFNISFPKQIQAGVKSIDEARKRSNNLTAVLLAKGVDSAQIGRDLGMMISGHAGADDGRQHRQAHADDAIEVAATCSFLVGQTAQTEDKEDGRTNVGDRGQARGHEGLFS